MVGTAFIMASWPCRRISISQSSFTWGAIVMGLSGCSWRLPRLYGGRNRCTSRAVGTLDQRLRVSQERAVATDCHWQEHIGVFSDAPRHQRDVQGFLGRSDPVEHPAGDPEQPGRHCAPHRRRRGSSRARLPTIATTGIRNPAVTVIASKA